MNHPNQTRYASTADPERLPRTAEDVEDVAGQANAAARTGDRHVEAVEAELAAPERAGGAETGPAELESTTRPSSTLDGTAPSTVDPLDGTASSSSTRPGTVEASAEAGGELADRGEATASTTDPSTKGRQPVVWDVIGDNGPPLGTADTWGSSSPPEPDEWGESGPPWGEPDEWPITGDAAADTKKGS